MPSTKVLTKSAPPKDKVKRKHVELDTDVASTDKTSVEKPSKKSRKDDASATSKLVRPSGKQTKEKKAVKITEAVEISVDEVEAQIEKKVKPKKKTKTVVDAAPKVAQKTPKAKETSVESAPAAPVIEEGGDSEGPGAAEEEEEEIHLQGFSSESDSSDEEMDVADAPPLDMSTLPAFSKDDAVVQRKLEKARKHPSEERGVIYLGRIPHGFYEDQMRVYFTQFGDVTRLRLSRNKKTGRSKHYAFVEFSSSAVADIVSETMHNYLLLGHIIQCKVIPKDQVHPELWVGANKKWRFVPRDRLARLKQNKPRTEEEQQRAESKLLARQKKKQAKLLASGIDYDFQEVAYKPTPKA